MGGQPVGVGHQLQAGAAMTRTLIFHALLALTVMTLAYLVDDRERQARETADVARARSVIYAPRGKHSEKPEAAWAVIERASRSSLEGDVRGVEFFARTQRPGWGAWGTLNGPHTPAVFRPAQPAQ